MLDLKTTLNQLDDVKAAMANRNSQLDFSGLEQLAARRKELILLHDAARFEQRQANDEMRAIDKKSEAFTELRNKLKTMSDRLKEWDVELAKVEAEISELLLVIPTLPHASVPVGKDESANEEITRWGELPTFDFEPKPHWELGEALGILDFERGAKVSGARFTFLLGAAARLERALINFMLDVHTREHGYHEILPPFLVNRAAMTGTGQLPKFEADAFKTDNDLFLIPTAEVPVTNYHRDELLDGAQLPIRYVAYTPCFRLEAGSYGKDTRGLIRQHQFDKVELVKFVLPENSYEELDKLLDNACEILRRLKLPYRVVALSTGDLGFSAAKCFDIEVWLPAQKCYREISSCSNFEDFQARRASIRFRREPKAKPEFVHTLNGSALAVGRTLVAILENYQQADGSVVVPEVLRPYAGIDRISLASRP